MDSLHIPDCQKLLPLSQPDCIPRVQNIPLLPAPVWHFFAAHDGSAKQPQPVPKAVRIIQNLKTQDKTKPSGRELRKYVIILLHIRPVSHRRKQYEKCKKHYQSHQRQDNYEQYLQYQPNNMHAPSP